MRLDRQNWVLVALGALLLVASLLPWLGDDSAWTLYFAPLVFVVHIPVVVAVTLVTLRRTNVLKPPLPVLDDDQWLKVTATYALIGSVSGLVLWRMYILDRPFGDSSAADPGAGAFIAIAASIALVVVVFAGHRIPVLQDAARAPEPGPRWVSLPVSYATGSGRVLGTDEWFLATERDGITYLEIDGVETPMPPGTIVNEAPRA
jgi:hypothetical protein